MSNLITFNEIRRLRYIKLIKKSLIAIDRRQPFKFKTFHSIASLIEELTGISAKTLSRNVEYRGIIQIFLNQKSRYDESIDISIASNSELQLKIKSQKLEMQNLREQLRIYKGLLGRKPSKNNLITEFGQVTQKYSDVDFTYQANVFLMLLTRFESYIQLNIDAKELLDLTAKPSNRVIVSGEKLEPFIRWFTKS